MTDEHKKALESAHTDEEKKAVAEKFKDEIRKLSDEELDGVAGGSKGDPCYCRDANGKCIHCDSFAS